MASKINLVVYPAKDLDASKAFFNVYLDTKPYAESDYYVGYRLDDLEIGLDPNGTAVIGYVDVEDIEAALKRLTDAGAEIATNPKSVGGGLTVAQVSIGGNVLGLRQQPK